MLLIEPRVLVLAFLEELAPSRPLMSSMASYNASASDSGMLSSPLSLSRIFAEDLLDVASPKSPSLIFSSSSIKMLAGLRMYAIIM